MNDPAAHPLVVFIAHQPGLAERLLRSHVDDGRGRCAVCRISAQAHQPWPCTIHRCATDAAGQADAHPDGGCAGRAGVRR